MATSHKIKFFSVAGLFIASIFLVIWMAQNPQGTEPQANAKERNARQNTVTYRLAGDEKTTVLSPDMKNSDPYLLIDPPLKGWKAPDFNVSDATGNTVKLSDYQGKNNVVLIFYQGSFCSVCGKQLSNLQKHLKDFAAHDAKIIAISADDKDHAMQTLGERGLSFKVVPDPQKTLIKSYGVANLSKGGMAWPSAFIINKEGKVHLAYAEKSGHRLHANELLTELSKLTGKPAPTFGYDD